MKRVISSFKAIQVLAAEAVKERDPEYLERYIMRWYSKTFFTPMSQVAEIPLQEIYQHFFEEYYENLQSEDDEKFAKEIAELIETDEERQTRLKAEAAEELAAQQLIKASEVQNASIAGIKDGEKPKGPKPKLKGTDNQGAMMPESIELPPDVDIQFALAEDFEKMINGLSSFHEVLAKTKAENDKKKKPEPKLPPKKP